MYIEFVVIYIALFIIALMIGAVIFLLVKLMKRGSAGTAQNQYYSGGAPQYGNQGYSAPQYGSNGYGVQQQYANNGYGGAQNNGIVFCKNCATQYDSSRRVCPKCGTPR